MRLATLKYTNIKPLHGFKIIQNEDFFRLNERPYTESSNY